MLFTFSPLIPILVHIHICFSDFFFFTNRPGWVDEMGDHGLSDFYFIFIDKRAKSDLSSCMLKASRKSMEQS